MRILEITNDRITFSWEVVEGAESYRIFWSDRETRPEHYRLMKEVSAKCLSNTLEKSTHVPNYILVRGVKNGIEEEAFQSLVTPVHFIRKEQLECLNRGLAAVRTKQGIFLSWRLFVTEVCSADAEAGRMTGTDFCVYRDGEFLALVEDSTNYLDEEGNEQNTYTVAPVLDGITGSACDPVSVWEKEYLDIPIQKPEDGLTPAGESYTYSANDMSVADVDGDGDYEYLVKWDPSNSHDVSMSGYTGSCLIDCYKLDGRHLWRLDLGPNIRAGAHYTQFICYDFDGDGKAEMAVKTAPGTKMTVWTEDGEVLREFYITMPEEDRRKGYSHEDSYVCSAGDYYRHMTEVFLNWQDHPEVAAGNSGGMLWYSHSVFLPA